MKEKMLEYLKWYSNLSGSTPNYTDEVKGFINSFFKHYDAEKQKKCICSYCMTNNRSST